MEFLMSETKVYAILTAGYDRKERMEGRILGEEHAMAGSFFLRKREKMKKGKNKIRKIWKDYKMIYLMIIPDAVCDPGCTVPE